MAKDNLFLGTARGSVGDVTFYQRDGVQVARKRNRQVANPKSSGQATQRALFAPVAKFYAPLAEVLEKSFEGKNRSKSYTEFLRLNIRAARLHGWLLPKDTGFFPMPYQLSAGTVQPLQYVFGGAGSEGLLISDSIIEDGAASTIGDVSKIFEHLGYLEGDQVTVIGVKSPLAGDDLSGDYFPVWFRFNLAVDSTVSMSTVERGVGFDYDAEDGLSIVSIDNYHLHAAAIIMSRYSNGVWRRSTQFLAVNEALMEYAEDADNTAASRASYMSGSTTPVSDVYLDGSVNNLVALSDNSLAELTSIHFTSDPADVSYVTANKSGRAVRLLVKIGSDWMLTASTKGALPQGVTPPEVYLVGDNDDVQAWLQSQGVAASLF